jgi:hypothetical protein
MQNVTPIFMRHATGPAARQEHGSRTGTGVSERGALTFEFRDNPFESLVRKVSQLLDRDPKEALRLLKATLTDKIFTAPRELERLGDKLDETLLKLQEMKQQGPAADLTGPAFAAAPALTSAFSREAFGLPAPEARPAAPAPALSQTPHPFAAPAQRTA